MWGYLLEERRLTFCIGLRSITTIQPALKVLYFLVLSKLLHRWQSHRSDRSSCGLVMSEEFCGPENHKNHKITVVSHCGKCEHPFFFQVLWTAQASGFTTRPSSANMMQAFWWQVWQWLRGMPFHPMPHLFTHMVCVTLPLTQRYVNEHVYDKSYVIVIYLPEIYNLWGVLVDNEVIYLKDQIPPGVYLPCMTGIKLIPWQGITQSISLLSMCAFHRLRLIFRCLQRHCTLTWLGGKFVWVTLGETEMFYVSCYQNIL